MEGRSYEGNTSLRYRFGFNTQEKDDEVYGEGNASSAMFWEYDTRLGRRWNLDPKPQISISNYVCFNNNPILLVDILGDVAKIDGTRREKRQFLRMLNNTTGNKYKIDKKGYLYNRDGDGKPNTVTNKKVSAELSALVEKSICTPEIINIKLTKNDPTIAFDRWADAKVDLNDLKLAPREFQAGALGHIFSERLNCPGPGGYSNVANRTEANWLIAHDNFAIPADSRIVTGMLGIAYGERTINIIGGTGAQSFEYRDRTLNKYFTMTIYSYYTEEWQYGTQKYTVGMGMKNTFIPSSSNPSGVPGYVADPQPGKILSISK